MNMLIKKNRTVSKRIPHRKGPSHPNIVCPEFTLKRAKVPYKIIGKQTVLDLACT